MEEVELTERQQRVYKAAAEAEAEGSAGTLDDLAGRAGLPPDETRTVLSALVNEADLVREVGSDDPVVGPRYRVKGQPAPR